MFFRHQTAHHVRHHQPDEADRPGHRHRRAPQSSAIASRPSSLVWTRLTPRPSATLSPSASTLRRGAMISATPRPISAGTQRRLQACSSSVRPGRRPAECASPARRLFIENYISPPRHRRLQTLTARTPHDVMRSGVRPPRPAEASAITPPNSSPAPQVRRSAGARRGKRRRTGPAPRSPPPPARRRR